MWMPKKVWCTNMKGKIPACGSFFLGEEWKIQTLDVALGWFDSINYRPQRSWGKVMFLHMSVILFTGGRSTWAGTPPGRYTPLPLGRYPQAGTPPGQVPPSPGQVPPLGRYTPGRYTSQVPQCILGYGQQAGGMHSCFLLIWKSGKHFQSASKVRN